MINLCAGYSSNGTPYRLVADRRFGADVKVFEPMAAMVGEDIGLRIMRAEDIGWPVDPLNGWSASNAFH